MSSPMIPLKFYVKRQLLNNNLGAKRSEKVFGRSWRAFQLHLKDLTCLLEFHAWISLTNHEFEYQNLLTIFLATSILDFTEPEVIRLGLELIVVLSSLNGADCAD